MPAEIILQPSAHAAALREKREQLAAVRSRLAEYEAELAQLRAQLLAFESRYLRQVGVLYAQWDDLEARICELAATAADSAEARQKAAEARQRAQESHEAACAADTEPEDFEPAPDLKSLFRELAKRIHPDVARDESEAKYLHMLMSRANHAYHRGDRDLLQRLLDDYRELNTLDAGESTAAESLRITRQIRHAERDLARLETERHALLAGETAQLFADVDMAAREHRDLLMELAAGLQQQIAEAQHRLDLLTDQKLGPQVTSP